ncbi:MAG: hypothetical protein ACKO96_05015 [Flammeovirgaceae bacterium]
MKTLAYNELNTETQEYFFKEAIRKKLEFAIYIRIEGFENETFDLIIYPREAIPYILYKTNAAYRQIINDKAKASVLNRRYLALPKNEDIEIFYKENLND